jgi:hypothetical protein
MGDGDDLNLVQKLAINDGKWVPVERGVLGAIKMRRIESRQSVYTVKSWEKLLVKPVGSLSALAGVPRMSGFDLPPCSGMIL